MRADLAARLRRAMRREFVPKTGVISVTGVATPPRYASKPQELRQLRPLRLQNDDLGKSVSGGVIDGISELPESVRSDIEERAAFCARSVPAIYLDAWARLNHQKPLRVSEVEWRQALDDGGRFLDAWGWVADSEWAWAPGELFDVPRAMGEGGLIWRLGGALVEAYGPDHVRLSDGRIIERTERTAEAKDRS